MAFRAKNGQFNGGYPRLGYDIDFDNKCLVPAKPEIHIVTEMFQTYLKTGSLTETATILNAKGYRMKSWTTRKGEKCGGKKFQKSNISRILKDPVYIGKVKYKTSLYPGQHKAIISEDLFSSVQSILVENNIAKTSYRTNSNQFYLKGILYCASCHSSMSPSFALSKGKKYFYYRCTANNDRSKNPCKIGSVNARQIESLVVDELKYLGKDPRIIEGVVENATKDQRARAGDLNSKKKVLQDKLLKIDRKAKNLLGVLGEEGKGSKGSSYILKELDDLDLQSKQLQAEIEQVEFEANNLENKIVSVDVIRDNLKVFKDIYDNLTPLEKYDLLHLLIKRIVYHEVAQPGKDGEKKGKIKMDLWELPPINPSKKDSAKGFAESTNWLPEQDSNLRHGG